MIKKLIFLLCGLISSQASLALSGQEYMDRFNTYLAYSQRLPINPTPTFLEFVKGTSPLSNKLRDRWLYELARIRDWATYTQYYQPTNDINLACFAQIAKYNLGLHQEALNGAAPIWLAGESQPKACSTLFDMLLKDEKFDQNLITQRINLALERRNVSLARYLMKQYKTPHLADVEALNTVYQNPKNISKLHPGNLSGEIYLYGLKRIAAQSIDKAVELWTQGKKKHILNEAQQNAFLAHVALYKAMRNNEDTVQWFAKIKPQYYTDVLLEWQIRFALKNKDWPYVSELIHDSKNKDAPCWQYWLARSLEEQGKKDEARALYEPLAQSRQYYGFLASMRLGQTPSFTNEMPVKSSDILKPYQSILEQIKSLYRSKNINQASRLLNDFISELPKNDASAVVYWVDSNLRWYGKSVYLSNNELLNNQLALRFPLAYESFIKNYARKYAIPPEFVYAIIRQESSFREDATSFAGARGLMQIMPYTAGVVSKADKITYSNKDQLFLSEKNINIGIAYLKQLAKRFSNNPILIAAAYNAGPKQVVYWLKTHPPKEIDIWIETLPWQETRNYLKNVMAFYVVYQYRLNQKPNLQHFLEPL